MKFISVFVIFIFAGFATARRIEIYRIDPEQAQEQNFVPVYKSVNDFAESLAEEKPKDENLVLLKPLETEQVNTPELRNIEQSADNLENSGRTFNHFLLLKSLIQTGGGGGCGNGGCGGGGGCGHGGCGGGDPGFIYPIIINTPLNLTNVNNNSVINNPPAAAAAAAAAAVNPVMLDPTRDVRINLIGVPQMQQWPMQMQMPMQVPMQMPMQNIPTPTEVTYQREASSTVPTYTIAMVNFPGNTGFTPAPTQYLRDTSNNNQKATRRVFKWPISYNTSPQNPFAAFSNSFRGIQFL